MTTSNWIAGLLAAGVFCAQAVCAQQAPAPVARLTAVQGNVLVSRADSMSAATGGEALSSGMRVITTAGAKATITYTKGCSITLDENQRYTIRDQAECDFAHAPPLGEAAKYAVIGGSKVANEGASVITGDLGVSPGTGVTGFPPGRMAGGGIIHPADESVTKAQADVLTAYDDLLKQACGTKLSGQDLGGQRLTPGVYCFPSTSARLSGELVLDAQGDPRAIWVFQVGTTLTTLEKSTIKLENGAQRCNIFWQVGTSAALGKESIFAGNVLAIDGITVANKTNMVGRLLARAGPVEIDTSQVDRVSCVVAAPLVGTGGAVGILGAAAIAVGAGIHEFRQSSSPN